MMSHTYFLGLVVSLGNVAAVPAWAAQVRNYQYDARGRLTTVCQHAQGRNYTRSRYESDSATNRTKVQVINNTVNNIATANSSFEEPDVGAGYRYNPPSLGVQFRGLSGIAANGSDWGFSPAPSGEQVAFLRGMPTTSGAIEQSISNLSPGQSYVISFKAARRPNYGLAPITVSVAGTELLTIVPPSHHFTSHATDPFRATSSNMSMLISVPVSETDTGSAIEDVVVQPAHVANDSMPNLSFENPSVDGRYQYNPAAQGISFHGHSGIAANGSDWGFASAPDGSQVAFLRGMPTLAGSFELAFDCLTPGQSYALSFQAARRPGYAFAPITVSRDGTQLQVVSPPSTTFTTFTTPNFVATSAIVYITFSVPMSFTDSGSAIDDVALHPMW